MTLDTIQTIDAAELADVKARARPFMPPRVRQDWPNLDFSSDSLQGIVINALGMQLASAFQAIRAVDGSLVAEEALLRAKSHGLQIPPVSVFRIAAAQDQLVAFDRLCRTLHLLNYLAYARPHERLFLNVHPRLLTEVAVHGVVFDEILQSVHWSAEHITLEFPDRDLSLGNPAQIRQAVQSYRQRGFKIAIDDFGENTTQLDAVWDLEPDVIKLGRQFLLRCEAGGRQGKSLAHLVRLLHEMGVRVVMEGIETAEQKQRAIDAGVDLLQGYFLGEPRAIGTV